MMKSADYQLDQHLRFKHVSPALARQFKMKKSELEGERFDTMVTQSCAPRFLEAILETFRGVHVPNFRIEVIQKKRKKLDMEISLSPINPNGTDAVKGIRGKMRFLDERIDCDKTNAN